MMSVNEDIKTKENTMSSLEQKEKRMEDILKRLEEQEKLEDKKSIVEKVIKDYFGITFSSDLMCNKMLQVRKVIF